MIISISSDSIFWCAWGIRFKVIVWCRRLIRQALSKLVAQVTQLASGGWGRPPHCCTHVSLKPCCLSPHSAGPRGLEHPWKNAPAPDSLEPEFSLQLSNSGLRPWVWPSVLRLSPSPEEESYFQPSICFVFNVQKGCTLSGTLFISSRLYNGLLHKQGVYCWPLWSCQLGEHNVLSGPYQEKWESIKYQSDCQASKKW